MVLGTAYTVTINNLTTVSGDPLPATLTFTFTYAAPAWTATVYQSNLGPLGSLADAQSVVNTPSTQSWSQVFQTSTINFTAGSTASGRYTNDALMPNQTALTTEWDNYVISATGTVYIPTVGNYTFDVNSDAGFSLTIFGATFTSLTHATNVSASNWMAWDGGQSSSDTLGVVNFKTIGYYPIRLLYFHGTGPSSVEVSAASGSYTAWSSAFHLIGDTASGGLRMGGFFLDTTAPPAPPNLSATPTTSQIKLAWSACPWVAQRCRSLQHLSQWDVVRHVDHHKLHGHHCHFLADTILVPDHCRQL